MQWSSADKESLLARRPAILLTFHGIHRRQQTPQVHKDQAGKKKIIIAITGSTTVFPKVHS